MKINKKPLILISKYIKNKRATLPMKKSNKRKIIIF